MYVAWRELRGARGRFVLVGTVVALITLLVGFLTGLTGGLAAQSVSAVLSMPADRIVLADAPAGSGQPSFDRSTVTARTATTYRETGGVTSVEPVGISQLSATHGRQTVAVAVVGGAPGWWQTPEAAGRVTLSRTAASDLGVGVGDTVAVAGTPLEVARVTDDLWYSHTPVVSVTLPDWQALAARTSSTTPYATVLAVRGSADWAAVAERTGTVAERPLQSTTAIGAFRSEIGSLGLIIAMLFGISTLVVGAFFAVWAVQRRGDVAVLKALGASRRAVLRDAVGQALVVLVAGAAVGLALVVGLGLAARGTLPFVLNGLTTVLPAGVMVAVGAVGAVLSLRPVLSADPLTALGSNR